ncbi:peptide deformylase [Rhodothermaceae bacterium RA]|nr:peptide deformylase [Rhodothermaceae bacterium RA]
MVLPIHVYGDPILRRPADPVEENGPELQQLIENMVETMHAASGIGLAAPQVGRTERLFVVDLTPMADEIDEEVPPQPMVFINPTITEESEETTEFEEGCLSIPEIREIVRRPERIRVEYRDRNFTPQVLEADGLLARVIQHELDHLDGILFVDHISAFRRQLLKRRLREMARGEVEADYALALPPGEAMR